MRFVVALLLAALCAQLASGAVLVRFINTVPNTITTATSFSSTDATVTPAFGGLRGDPLAPVTALHRGASYYEIGSTRVGLQYLTTNAAGTSVATTVWTEANVGFGPNIQNHGIYHDTAATPVIAAEPNADRVNPVTFAYNMAMPPLRAYHNHGFAAGKPTAVTEAVSVDRVAHYQRCIGGAGTCYGCTEALGCSDSAAVDLLQFQSNGGVDPSVWDTMDHFGLKADGISQYLSFAAGTYKFQAYGVGGSQTFPVATAGSGGTSNQVGVATAVASMHTVVAGEGANAIATLRSVIQFPKSMETFEFKDWNVYTIVATGTVAWPVGAATDSVKLRLLTESTASTPFGKASIRFFHAIETFATSGIDIYQGTTTTKIASALTYGSASAYMDIAPKNSIVFPIDTTAAATIAGSSSMGIRSDIRAGTRATIICAVNDLQTAFVFCRQIPSRVVAYVRLVNDMGGVNANTIGKAGATPLKDVKLSLWASFEYPSYAVQTQGNQNAALSVNAGMPIMTPGLYPVTSGTMAGAASGYGEVHVPVFVMDRAVTAGIFASGNGLAEGAVATNTALTAALAGNNGLALAARSTPLSYSAIAGFQSDIFRGGFCIDGAAGAAIRSATAYCPRDVLGLAGPDFAARFKRVNIIVKTDAFATVSDYALKSRFIPVAAALTAGAAANVINTDLDLDIDSIADPTILSSSIDIPMEPGQFYTFYTTVQMKAALAAAGVVNGANADGTLIAPVGAAAQTGAVAVTALGYNRDDRALPWTEDNSANSVSLNGRIVPSVVAAPLNGRILEFGLTLDRSIDDLSAGVTAGMGRIRFQPFGMVSEAHALMPNGLIHFGAGPDVTACIAAFGPAPQRVFCQTGGYATAAGLTGFASVLNTNQKALSTIGAGAQANALNHPDVVGPPAAVYRVGAVYIRQFHNYYGSFDGIEPHRTSQTVPAPLNVPTVTLTQKRAAGADSNFRTGVAPLSNYVRLDPHVLYMPTLKPSFAAALAATEVPAGTYSWTVDTTLWPDKDVCMFGVPSQSVTVAAGDVATVFVMNYLGCRTSGLSDDVTKLTSVIAYEMADSPSAPAAAASQTFFGAASSVSSSIALCLAALVAVMAIVF